MKTCSKCSAVKDEELFIINRTICKECNRIYHKNYRDTHKDTQKEYGEKYRENNKETLQKQKKEYYEKNKENIIENNKIYYKENKKEILVRVKQYSVENNDTIVEYRKKYRKNNKEFISKNDKEYYQNNRDPILARQKQYQEDNKDHIKQYKLDNKKTILKNTKKWQANKRKTDPAFKIRCLISGAIFKYLKSKGSSKNGNSILKYLPYTIMELKKHIEMQFEPWMTWENHGNYNSKTWDDNDPTTWTWQLDHIIPHSTFKYTSMEDQSFKDCWALSNLRPYSAKQNQLDGVTRIRHKKDIKK